VKHVSGKRMCKVLEAHGWTRSRITGSHHIYSNPAVPGVNISVPVHGNKSLRAGTQRTIMRHAGLTDADL
jgi:predicted RNA binding protein YcfA (HicA-like mRNA interferase family)